MERLGDKWIWISFGMGLGYGLGGTVLVPLSFRIFRCPGPRRELLSKVLWYVGSLAYGGGVLYYSLDYLQQRFGRDSPQTSAYLIGMALMLFPMMWLLNKATKPYQSSK